MCFRMHLSTAQLDRTIPPTKKKNENVSIDATFFCNENAREIDKIIYSLNKRMVDFDPHHVSTSMKRRIIILRGRTCDECAICLSTMRNRPVVYAKCGHALHLRCEQRLIASNCLNKYRCPTCRCGPDPVISDDEEDTLIDFDDR